MNILWLAPTPYTDKKESHPAPWITSLADNLAKQNNIHITILNYNSAIKKKIETFEQNGIQYIYIKPQKGK